ncbi:MAG: hypothetical protein KC445_03245 [Anaerolineales bacterium]|nr:hypothetical protein [Anaerolineales bacterium]
MNKKSMVLMLLGISLLLLAACGGPSQEFRPDQVILSESFSNPGAWEKYVSESVDFQVNDGVYRVQTDDGGYIWGLNNQEHTDVIIEVTSVQSSAYEDNAYGVMCRADVSNNGDGYYFLISGDGYYAIAEGDGDNVNQLVEWTSSSAINTGQASNTIRAVCVNNYLALYVNGKFVAETTDSSYKSGFAGFAATAFNGGDVDVSFDDLTISTAVPQ